MRNSGKVGVVGFTTLTVVSMIDGIIMIPTMVAGVGSISIFAWFVTMVGVMILAHAFSKCGMYTKKSGGMGGYAEYVFGKAGNFIANYAYGISLLIANVGIAISVVAYSSEFAGVTLSPMAAALCAGFILFAMTIVNFFGTGLTVKIGTVAMLFTLVPVCLMSLIGVFFFNPQTFINAWNPHHYSLAGAVSASSSFTLWAFLGLESACSNMEKVENPHKNVPIAVTVATVIIGIFSIAYTTIIQGIVPNEVLAESNAPFGVAMAYMLGDWAGKATMAFLIAGCAGALIAWQFTLGELLRSGAAQGYFPSAFAPVNKKGVPYQAMILMMGMQMILIGFTVSPSLVKQFDALLQLSTFENLVPYILSMSALDAMQKVSGYASKKTKWAGILGAIYSLYACFSCGEDAITYGTIVLLSGCLIYGLYAGRWVVKYTPIDKR